MAGRSPRLAVRWHGYVFDSSGFADEGRQFILGLDALGVPITIVPFPSYDARWALPRAEVARLQALMRTPASSDRLVSVFHAAPTMSWRIEGAAYHVGRAMFETDRVPEEWPADCEALDEIWVPSAFNMETFRHSGVPAEKLVRVPEAIDVHRFTRPARRLDIPGARRFNFLSVFGWGLRKGWDVLVRAFVEEFSRDEGVALILHTQPGAGGTRESLHQDVQAVLRRHGLGRTWPPHVVFHTPLLRVDQLPSLYKAADAFVLPTRGEGWGRPFMEAMLMARPVIATRSGGQMDFLRDDNAYLVDGRPTDVPDRAGPDFPFRRPHRWVEPSLAQLRRLMREVFEDREGAGRKVRAARETIIAGYDRRRVAEQVRGHLERIDDTLRPAPRRRRPAGSPTVLWQGVQLVHTSFARVNHELTRELTRAGCELVVHGFETKHPEPREDDRVRRVASRMYALPSRPIDVHVHHRWPPNLVAPAEGRWVVMQPWEFGSMPRRWQRAFTREVDEVWVPTRHVRDEYIRAGVSPERIAVIPNGVNERQFHPGVGALDLGRPAEFRFLFVGGTIYRKGIDLLLAAYRLAFDASDDVCLVIKDVGADTVYKGQTHRARIRALQTRGRGPAIVYLDGTLPDAAVAGLYRACDVLVHPYRGEGFGLPILEAMACGIPAIVTNGGACLDFCDSDNSILVPARRRYLPQALLGPLETVHRPWVWEVDPRDLAERLRHAYDHPAEMKARGERASGDARGRWTWRQAARTALERIERLRNAPGR
jgi:glycosyltransferase involved in cell wall biosynthesis